MSLYSIPTLLTAVILGFIGILVYSKNSLSKANRIFGIFCLAMVVWLFGFSMMYSSSDPTAALLWAKIGFVGIVFIPYLSYHFMISFLNLNHPFLKYFYFFGVPAFLTNFFTPYIYKGVKLHYWGYYPVAGWLYFVFILMFLAFFTAGAVILYLNLNNPSLSILKRQQIKYVLLPFIPGTLAIVDYIGKYPGIDIYPFGYLFTLFFTAVIAYAIVRYRLMDVKLAVTRASLFVIVYCVILGLPFYFGAKTGLWIWSTVIMAILASIGPLIFNFLRRKAENLLLVEQRRYQKILIHAANGMIQEHNLTKLLKLIVYVINKTVNIEFTAIFLKDKESGSYRLRAIRDHKSVSPNIVLPENSELISLLKAAQETELYENAEALMQGYMTKPVGLVIPAFMDNQLLGILVMGEKRNRKLYTQDDINVFRILADQASLAIANCLYMEEVKKSQEQLFLSEKLASVGGMAEGVAHQIKNRLNQFSVAAGDQDFELSEIETKHAKILQEIPELRNSIAYARKCAKAVLDNVKKVNAIILGILNFAKIENKGEYFKDIDAAELINTIREYVIIKHELTDLPLVVDIKNSGTIYGVRAQIEEAVYNMLDNAYEAIDEKIQHKLGDEERKTFTPRITLMIYDNAVENTTMIRIADNGIGIKEKDKEKIFAPYFTTKVSSRSGVGIGMYIVRRIIEENHKGKIWFKSEYGEGTEVFIKLPKRGA